MHYSLTFSRYVARNFLIAFASAFLIFLVIVFIADFVELMRRTAGKEDITFSLLMGMALLRLPGLGTQVLPFSILLGAMFALMRMNRSHELVVARAAGVSVWQFLAPPILVAFLIGVGAVTVYNPVSAALTARYEALEAKFIRGRSSLLAVSSTGLWLRQADPNGKSVVHALRVSELGVRLEDVILLLYDANDTFTGRIDARSATLRDGYWDLKDVWISNVDGQPSYQESYRQPTTLTPVQVQESFAQPDTISFWALPHFIEMAEAAGFSAKIYRIHLHSLLSSPLLYATMVLLAAAFSLRISRFGGLGQLVLGAIMAGFLLFFLTRLSLALGGSGLIPAFLAAWAPAIIASFLGLAVLLHLEDG